MTQIHIISDSLTRIRNAQFVRKRGVELYYSKFMIGILRILRKYGYILDFESIKIRKGVMRIRVLLKYNKDLSNPSITEIRVISKPGKKVYTRYNKIKRLYGGLGTLILTTSRGVISDSEARYWKIGGEIICRVF